MIKSRKKFPWIIRLLIILGIIFLVLIVVYDKNVGYHFQKYAFVGHGKVSPYVVGTPLHEMDLETYEDYFGIVALSYQEDMKISDRIELPCDVDYYARKEDAEPIVSLKKGTMVWIYQEEELTNASTGYGLVCWPDYEEEWRYGYPFLIEEDTFETTEQERYYVRTAQLEQVATAFYYENIGTAWKVSTPWDFPKEVTQNIDRTLYYGGIYCPERWK